MPPWSVVRFIEVSFGPITGVPLLEVNELEEVTSDTHASMIESDFKLHTDIASIHS